MKHTHSFLASILIASAVFCPVLPQTTAFAVSDTDSETEFFIETDTDSETELLTETPTGSVAETFVSSTPTPGLYEISSSTASDLVLELQTCTITEQNENTLQLYSPLDTNQQKFYIEETGTGTYRISSLSSGEALTAEFPADFVDTGVTIDLQGDDSVSDNALLQEETLYSAAVLLADIDHSIESVSETPSESSAGSASETPSESSTGSASETLSESSTEAETESFAESSTESVSEALSESLTESASETPSESSAESASDTVHPQLWSFELTDDGFYYIGSADGKYLTIDSRYAYKGASVTLKSFTGEANQKWHLEKTWSSAAEPVDTDLINPYADDGSFRNLRISLQFGENTEVLTAEDFSAWMIETEAHELTLDREAITAYVAALAEKYDTQGKPRRFTTSYGTEITLYKGNFGWKLDESETVSLILELAASGKSRTTEPKWSHQGSIFDSENDIGDSYVEVDLTNQKVWLYVDGEQILETDCVTGTYGTDRQTPGGVYSVYYRQSPDVLEGEGYSSPVEYWMAFNGGIGLHDANWRSTFGGDIYKTNGSHGCINLPTEAAAKIYEVAQIGFPVVCYN